MTRDSNSWTNDDLETFEKNRLSWDERVESHWQSEMYRRHADDLRAGGHCLHQESIRDLGDVDGRSLIHLQCHMGMETLSWETLGAKVVGVDFSQPAIAKAELLRDELGLKAHFHHANVYDAPEVASQRFDIVFVSVGSLCWLPDVRRWSKVVSSLLRPNGRLYLQDVHPFTEVFDDSPDGRQLEIRYPYLDAGRLFFDEPGSYADLAAQFEHTASFEYVHTLGEIITSLVESGLVIDRLEESALCVWPRFKLMQQTSADEWSLPDPILSKLPNIFTLMAHKGT